MAETWLVRVENYNPCVQCASQAEAEEYAAGVRSLGKSATVIPPVQMTPIGIPKNIASLVAAVARLDKMLARWPRCSELVASSGVTEAFHSVTVKQLLACGIEVDDD